jgi:hypothetical protein
VGRSNLSEGRRRRKKKKKKKKEREEHLIHEAIASSDLGSPIFRSGTHLGLGFAL